MCLKLLSIFIEFISRKYLFIGRHQEESSEDTKRVIRMRKSKNNRQHNGQKKKVQKDKQRSTKHTYKSKDRVTLTPLKTGVNAGAPKG